MALTGSDVDVSEAETYFDGDPRAEDFLEEDMEWYLKRATKIIDGLPLQGRKYLRDGTQDRQFPRDYDDGHYDCDEITGEAEVPQAILDACCEEALAIYAENSSTAATKRAELQEQGVKSYTNGKLSETYGPRGGGNGYGIRSPAAWRILSKYIARMVPIL